MELDPKDVLVFQVKRDFVNLYKSFLVVLEDLEKEVSLAVNKFYSFNHWGKHFLISLNFAHMR